MKKFVSTFNEITKKSTITAIGIMLIPFAILRLLFRAFKIFLNVMDSLIMRWYKIMLTITWLIAGLCFYWAALDSSNPIKSVHYHDAQFFIPKNGKIANALTYTKSICVSKNMAATITPQYTDDITYMTQQRDVAFTRGCHDETVFIAIPPELTTGVTYTYSSNYVIPINPLRDLSYRVNIFTITIVNADKGEYDLKFLK